MDEDELKETVADWLDEEGYYVDPYTLNNGMATLIDKCTTYVLNNPSADEKSTLSYAKSLITSTQYQIIWGAKDPSIPIQNWFNDWIPDGAVTACFIGAYDDRYYTWDYDTPKWIDLPYAPYYAYDVPSNIQNEIKQEAIDEWNENEDEKYSEEDLCERCLVLAYKTLK